MIKSEFIIQIHGNRAACMLLTWALKLRSPDPEMRAGGFEASVRTLSKNIELMGIDSGD